MSTFVECPVCGGTEVVFKEDHDATMSVRKMEQGFENERKEQRLKNMEASIKKQSMQRGLPQRITPTRQFNSGYYNEGWGFFGFLWRFLVVCFVCYLIQLFTGLTTNDVENPIAQGIIFIINICALIMDAIVALSWAMIKAVGTGIYNGITK
jgi:uncharacterized C2H2 Zn-finger protein